VVEEIEGVVNEVPVPKEDPPVDAAYQLIVPELAAPSTTVPEPQRLPFVTEEIVGIVVVLPEQETFCEVAPVVEQTIFAAAYVALLAVLCKRT
jgi:hypothetical protein